MKKLLPQTAKNPKGFTLVELMVVIAIIAILSIIGISIYGNVQRSARDGVRRAEITSLGKSIETAKDPTASTYTYSADQFSADYPQNKPVDPLKSETAPFYCVKADAAAVADPTASVWTNTTTCPTGWSTLMDNTATYQGAATLTDAAYWKICTRLENTGNPLCVASNKP